MSWSFALILGICAVPLSILFKESENKKELETIKLEKERLKSILGAIQRERKKLKKEKDLCTALNPKDLNPVFIYELYAKPRYGLEVGNIHRFLIVAENEDEAKKQYCRRYVIQEVQLLRTLNTPKCNKMFNDIENELPELINIAHSVHINSKVLINRKQKSSQLIHPYVISSSEK